MTARRHRFNRRYYILGPAAIAAAALAFGRLGGTLSLPLSSAPAASLPRDAALDAARHADREAVVLAQQKRIMGRLRSLEMVRRVALTVRPLVDRAVDSPSLSDDFARLAAGSGMSTQQYREYFKSKQEADLLLESGGDPDA